MRRPELTLMNAQLGHGCQNPTENFFVTGILRGEAPHYRLKIPKAIGLDIYMDSVHHGRVIRRQSNGRQPGQSEPAKVQPGRGADSEWFYAAESSETAHSLQGWAQMDTASVFQCTRRRES